MKRMMLGLLALAGAGTVCADVTRTPVAVLGGATYDRPAETFGTFGLVTINDAGVVAFSSVTPIPNVGNVVSVFSWRGGLGSVVMRADQRYSNAPALNIGLPTGRIHSGADGQFAYAARGGLGNMMVSVDHGVPRLLAYSGPAIAGVPQITGAVRERIVMSPDGRLAFDAGNNIRELWLGGVTGVQRVWRDPQAAPGYPAGAGLSNPLITGFVPEGLVADTQIGGGGVEFSSATAVVNATQVRVLEGPGLLEPRVPGGVVTRASGFSDVNSSGLMTFDGAYFVNGVRRSAIFAGVPGQMVVAAGEGDAVPGMPGRTFRACYTGAVTRSGRVGMYAQLDTEVRGIWEASAPGAPMSLLAIVGQQVANLPGATMQLTDTARLDNIAFNDLGEVAFGGRVRLADGALREAVFSTRGGELIAAMYQGERVVVNGLTRTIQGWTLAGSLSSTAPTSDGCDDGRSIYFNNRGEIVLAATFDEGGGAVFVLTVPTPGGSMPALLGVWLLCRRRRVGA